jgi:uncharacterized membrane protein YhhN
MTMVLAAVMAVAVAGTLSAETRRSPLRRYLKMAAATGFVAVALSGGALDTTFGSIMLVGLALSWIGDLALTYAGRTAFIAGLSAFFSAHVVYSVAFAVPDATGFYDRGIDWRIVASAGLLLAAIGFAVARRLLPRVPRELRWPVAAYIVVISVMVAFAVGHMIIRTGPLTIWSQALDWRIVAGAILFYVSDLAVARDRFVTPGIANRMWGLPAYFSGQFLLAWAAGGPL